MRVLVTGGAGLVGMNLRAELARRGHLVVATDITAFDRDDPGLVQMPLDDGAAMEVLARDNKIDAIVHAGAISGPMMSRDDPMTIVATNITATAGIVDIARRLSVRRFVFCSSVSVYGQGKDEVFTEDAPLRPTSLYGASKVAGEQLLRGFVADHGLAGTSLRIARVYGPYRRGNCPIQSMLKAAAQGREIELVGDPTFPYHFIHVDDVVRAIVEALEQQGQSGATEFNVAAPKAQTLPEIIAAVKEVMPRLSIRILPGENDVPDHQAGFDTKKITSALGWQAAIDVASGIERYWRFLSRQ
jgi:UDP-glucose 4-epimerase